MTMTRTFSIDPSSTDLSDPAPASDHLSSDPISQHAAERPSGKAPADSEVFIDAPMSGGAASPRACGPSGANDGKGCTGQLCARSWLHLALTPGLGASSARRLGERFGCACTVLAASESALCEVLDRALAQALLDSIPTREREIARALEWSEHPAQHLLTPTDPRYPAMFGVLADPPPVLYVRGDPQALARPAIALVGSRNASRDGLEIARSVAETFARAGLVIVSGLAAGIDSAAHRGALTAGGLTVGFVGTGADLIYPRAHRALAASVIEQGALVSELPLGSEALAHHFPRRNRLIAAQALAVVVVQAARQSGSLITARLAAELGREVMAFPGSIHSPLSKGCHLLLREGAALVEDASEIAALLQGTLARQGHPALAPTSDRTVPAGPAPELSADARQLLATLGWAPAAPDLLGELGGLDRAHTVQALLELELSGYLERLIDGRFQRIARQPASEQALRGYPANVPGSLLASAADRPV